MDIKILAVAAVAACALVGCDEQEDLSKYARWEPIHILGKEKTYYCRHNCGPGSAADRAYMPMLGGWGARRGLNKIGWFNQATPTNVSARIVYPYSVWESFGPPERRGPAVEKLKKFHETRPDMPFLLNGFLDSWFPWFMEDAYDCDRASYADFLKTYTNFVAFTTLNEADGAFSGYSSKKVTNVWMKAKMDEAFPPAKDYRDRLAWLDRAMARQQAMYFGEKNRYHILYSTNLKWGHVLSKYGVAILEYEAESGVVCSPWRYGMMHIRGAGRQYQVPWLWYTAVLAFSATRDGKDVRGEWYGPTEWCQTWYKMIYGKKWDENLGTARSTIRRAQVYGYFAGANGMTVEGEPSWLFDYVNKTNVLSKYGHVVEDVMQLSEKTPRGFCYTPAAVLTSYYEGMGRTGGGSGLGADAFLYTLVPILSEDGYRCCDRKKGDQGCMFNSEFGEICDVLVPDAGEKPGAFAAAFAPYKWAFLLGKFDTNQFERAAVESWVKAGGTLVVSVDNVGGDLISEDMVGVAFATNVVQCGSQLVEAATKRVCEGSMQQTFRRKPEWAKKTYVAPFTYRLRHGTPHAAENPEQQAKPLFVDESGNVIVWEHAVGKGRVLTMTAERGVPSVFTDSAEWKRKLEHLDYFWSVKPELVAGRITFPVQRELLRKCQRETMPVDVQGDIQWGVNKVRSKSEEGRSEGSHWLVWLLNNKGVKKFAYEEEEIDHAFDAKVKITDRRTGKVYEKLVPAGGYACVEIR